MHRKVILLLSSSAIAASLIGCQTIKSRVLTPFDDGGYKQSSQIKQVTWKKSGEVFSAPNDEDLDEGKTRLVFFRSSNDAQQSNSININIGVGDAKRFQASLQDGHHSKAIICKDSQIISVEVLDSVSNEVFSYSKNYHFVPQTTNYLQVGLTKKRTPYIKQMSAKDALLLLNGSKRQTHQISRVTSDCKVPSQTSVQDTIDPAPLDKQIPAQSPTEFNILFGFDSTGIKNNNQAELGEMADFIQSHPKTEIVLEGHTDNKGDEQYNLELSKSRADAVKDALVDDYNLNPEYLNTIGYGESKPVDTNNTEQGRQNNRRVVAIVEQENN